MSDLPERETRDALAEALYAYRGYVLAIATPWSAVPEAARKIYRQHADELLAILPSVGLEIGRSKSR